ncbi:MAG TPA: SAM-dependent methyltransferase [Tepidisphaeraceae bacterium]|jgi:23S rRNA (cytidine1920-2'-O)/16S rRNA (cytidine1409-2'-O)-methyltransferase|nr:SAM-dependent methyltransferase [Tepidisphaeraceae bacterium]
MAEFVSRAGLKLEHAMAEFGIDATGKVCADLGCNAGGFTECLLRRAAAKVYAVDTGYGMLEYKLRRDARVVAMERTNAMHVVLPEKVGVVVIDVAWTKQKHILPNARKLLAEGGEVVTLVKPHYEAEASQLVGGVLKEEELAGVMERVKGEMAAAGFEVVGMTRSPIKGAKGNVEMLAWLKSQ